MLGIYKVIGSFCEPQRQRKSEKHELTKQAEAQGSRFSFQVKSSALRHFRDKERFTLVLVLFCQNKFMRNLKTSEGNCFPNILKVSFLKLHK